MDSGLWCGRVDNEVQDCVVSLCRKTAHSISNKQSQVIALHQVTKKRLQCDATEGFDGRQRCNLDTGAFSRSCSLYT
jgi:hypothetical protein